MRKTLSDGEIKTMITNRKEIEKFEKELLRNEKVDDKKNISIVNGRMIGQYNTLWITPFDHEPHQFQ